MWFWYIIDFLTKYGNIPLEPLTERLLLMEMYGKLTPAAIGVLMRAAVERALSTIQAETTRFVVTRKPDYDGDMTDLFTTADTKAQAKVVRFIEECFPGFGIIAEEEGANRESENGLYFTVDPLDGTKAYVRGQSHGIGSMLALVRDGKVIGVCIGDVKTGELFYYRPDSDNVHRLTPTLGIAERMRFCRPADEKSCILLRDPLEKYNEESQRFARAMFDKHLIDGGSIGIWMARLWKREVAALLLPPSKETPWDTTPVIGMSRKLGYTFWRPLEEGRGFVFYDPSIPKEIEDRNHDLLIVHERDLEALGLAD